MKRARKYGYSLVSELVSKTSSRGVKAYESMEKDHKKNGEKALVAPQEPNSLANSLTATPHNLVRE